MKSIIIKRLEIGAGIPKIIVPIMGKTELELLDEIEYLATLDFDVIEWRVDYFQQIEKIESIKHILKTIKQFLPEKPILFTFRTFNEGGVTSWPLMSYIELNKVALTSGLIDLIDIELFSGDEYVQELIRIAHQQKVAVILSNHDFEKTPHKNEIIARLRKMQDLGADIAKIAVMPNNAADVLTLLSATAEMNKFYAVKPLITMSMGALGAISRISGATFGSAMTFGVAKKASAPGQLNAKDLRHILHELYQNCS